MNITRSILLSIGLAALLAACAVEETETEKRTSPARVVETAPVKLTEYRETIFATGKLSLEEESRLSFKTGGIIKGVYVDEGQSVRKGQLLAVLDLDEIKAQASQARIGQQQASISVENARLALRLAERDYRNAQGLYQDSVATLEQLENAEVQLDNARNQLEAAQKGLAITGEQADVADFNLRYSRIIAPSNGIILKKLAEANELAGPGTPILFFGSNDKAKVIRVNLTDKEIIHVRLGDEAQVQFDAYPKVSFPGTVHEIASMADPYTNTYEVEIAVETMDKVLLSGFVGTVHIFTKKTANLLEIPINALLGADGMEGEVFVVEEGKALRTKVDIFRIDGSRLLVERGLDSTDQVITSGVGYLEDQQNVMISQR